MISVLYLCTLSVIAGAQAFESASTGTPGLTALAGSSDSYSAGSFGGYEVRTRRPEDYGFSCFGKYPALYGDGNYDCRVYHVCQEDGRGDSLECPLETKFNNYLGVCDWEFKIDRTCMPLYTEQSYNNLRLRRSDDGRRDQTYDSLMRKYPSAQ